MNEHRFYDSKTAKVLTRTITGLAIIFVLQGCGSEVKPHSQEVSYQSVAASNLTLSQEYLHTQTYTGVVRSVNTTGIGFELAGKLNSLSVDSGDSVKQGQILAKLDTSLLQSELSQLQATILQTQADIDLANSTLNRVLKLKLQNYVSEQQLDETKQQVASLQANKQRLEANLGSIQLRLAKSTLVAPFNGQISQRHHNLGEVVGLGSPVFTLIGNNLKQAYIGVPVDVVHGLDTLQAVTIRVGEQKFKGSIAGISAEVDSVSRTVQLRINLPADANVLNGEIAYFDYQHAIQAQGYWVPMSALTDGIRGLWNVYILKPVKEGYFVIERRDIEILYSDDQQAYIQGAISANDMIVSDGLHKLVAGQKVTPASTDVAPVSSDTAGTL